jgi:hypothetical protein
VLDRVAASATALDLTGAGSSLPYWAGAIIAGLVIIAGMLAFMRNGVDGVSTPLMHGALVLMIAFAGWWALDYFARRDLLAERQVLDARAFELAARAVAAGSALACLDAIAGDIVEDACEKAVFATPEATAAAVSYVAAQLSLLVSAGDYARRAGSGMTHLRHAIEADPFGIVAHVLAVRDGCTPAQCGVFALLQDPRRIGANLAERVFEARLKTYAAAWPTPGARPVASNAPPATAPQPTVATGPRVPNNLYFPSASSIPPVNIMTAEPAAPPPPHDTTGAAETTPSSRKQPPGAAPARQPPSSAAAPARSPPTPLAPPQ